MGEPAGLIDSAIDARAAGLAAADLIFVFGTRLTEPDLLAADLYRRCLAPFVVLTGGSDRQPDGLNEAEHHQGLLMAAGVPADSVIVENRSSNTYENVLFALPLIEQRRPNPRSAIAVVKRSHRRALITLAHHAPSIGRIYAVDYDIDVGAARIAKQRRHVRELVGAGVDPLVADGQGWRRSGSYMGRARTGTRFARADDA